MFSIKITSTTEFFLEFENNIRAALVTSILLGHMTSFCLGLKNRFLGWGTMGDIFAGKLSGPKLRQASGNLETNLPHEHFNV